MHTTNHPFARFAELQKLNDDRLEEFLLFLDLIVCRACWHARRGHVQRGVPAAHGLGGFMQSLEACKITSSQLKKWLADPKHGLTHGFCTTFFAFHTLTDFEKERWQEKAEPSVKTAPVKTDAHNEYDIERTVLACLIHDMIKSATAIDAGHDRELAQISTLLPKEAYCHSSPGETYAARPLIVGDRMDLLRYPDWSQWVDRQILEAPLARFGFDAALHFQKHIRPVLERITTDRNALWLAHSPETRWMDPGHIPLLRERHYPGGHWMQGSGHFSVSLGRLPANDNMSCLLHYAPSYNWTTGLIVARKLRTYGARLVSNHPGVRREHPFVRKGRPIPIREWTFFYQDVNDLSKLSHDDICVVRRNNFNRFLQTTQRIADLMEALAVYDDAPDADANCGGAGMDGHGGNQ